MKFPLSQTKFSNRKIKLSWQPSNSLARDLDRHSSMPADPKYQGEGYEPKRPAEAESIKLGDAT
jgi:hypothetical protein